MGFDETRAQIAVRDGEIESAGLARQAAMRAQRRFFSA